MSTPDDARAYPRRSNAASRRSTIVSWNVGLRGLRALTDARAAQKTYGRADAHGVRRIHGYGSMKALFDALGSDLKVICLQETKLSSSGDVERLERVEGWDGAHAVCESSNHRVGYSGVAVYWRSNEICPTSIERGVCAKGDAGESTMWAGEIAPFADDATRAKEIDGEGRALWVDFGEFVLCTVYVPAVFGDPAVDEKTAERAAFKRDFLSALEARYKSLRERGRNVILCGDWNIAPSWKLDRADEDPNAVEPRNPSRDWLAAQLAGDAMVDVFREFFPTLGDAFTCWNVASGAQLSNYGSRIDYFLCDRAVTLKRVRGVGVAQKFEGSDHAPVYLELEESMWRRRDSQQTPPSLAISMLYPGRQTTVDSIFARASSTSNATPEFLNAASQSRAKPTRPSARAQSRAGVSDAPKRKPEATLKDFFVVKSKKKEPDDRNERQLDTVEQHIAPTANAFESRETKVSSEEARGAWMNTFAKMAPPKCKHGETCKVRTVKKKESPHCGRVFFCCPRPAGARTNPDCDCGFFLWREHRAPK